MLFMQKMKGAQEKRPSDSRKEPILSVVEPYAEKGGASLDKVPVLSEEQVAEIERRKQQVEGFQVTSLNELHGFIGACLFDSEFNELLVKTDSDNPTALSDDIVSRKIYAVNELCDGEGLEDVLITLMDQYHLIRRLKSAEEVYIYLVLDRKLANLGLAKLTLQSAEEAIEL